MPSTSSLAINIERLQYHWPKQAEKTISIEQLQVPFGEHLFIQGASGSGKSTLLNLISGVLSPQSGCIQLLGEEITSLSNRQKDRFRADHLGIIFQQFNLLPYLNAIQNIELALNVSAKRLQKEQAIGDLPNRILELLHTLGLDSTIANQPANQLSIGQQQRVAVARALIGQPEIVIADEPTSSLDSDSRDQFIETLFQSAEIANSTVVFVSHDQSLKQHFSQHLDLAEINHTSAEVIR